MNFLRFSVGEDLKFWLYLWGFRFLYYKEVLIYIRDFDKKFLVFKWI